jgi:hypothetical protein
MRIMPRYTYIPKSISELNDFLGFMIVRSPLFEDIAFPGQSLATVFAELSESLQRLRPKLGEDRFQRLSELAQRVKSHFEADPNNDNGETRAGRKLLYEMKAVLRSRK